MAGSTSPVRPRDGNTARTDADTAEAVNGAAGGAGGQPPPATRRRQVASRHWSLRRQTSVIGVTCTLVIVLAIVVGSLALVRLDRARTDVVDELDPALLLTEQLTVSLVNQESGVRGFLATGDTTFLDPYEEGRRREATTVAALQQLAAAASRPELAAGLVPVLEAGNRWADEYAKPSIDAARAGSSRATPDPKVGKALFDSLRAAIASDQAGLQQARREARGELSSAATTLTVIGVALALAVVLLLIGLALWSRRTVTVPLIRLAGTVRSVAEGRFDRTVEVEAGPREVVQLAGDIDHMRGRILTELDSMRALNQRLDVQTTNLERSNRDLEQFAYAASHDLQEPLRKVTGFCELLASRYSDQLDERATTYIGFAVDGARRMSVLINGLLAFSRVGRSETPMEPHDLGVLLDHALSQLGRLIADTDATITHDPLPTVPGEAPLLTTLLQNLVGNAIKFRGAEPPRIHLGVDRQGERWRFSVTDNGIGIEPDYADKIFVIFQRLHAKDAYPGTGIGLAMCRKIVEYHGGEIWLDTAAEGPQPEEAGTEKTRTGSTFHFTLSAVGDAESPTTG
ncbi:MAG TPA: ATP-binding protein [Pseudonocardia sp.]|jgi:signal transduction histidine kinase